MASAPAIRMSEAEYLEYDATHEGKYQYVNGEVFAMAGASYAHNWLVANLITALGLRLRGTACHALPSDQRVRVAETGMYTYPDIAIVCGKPELGEGRPRTLLNPTVLIEVLSETTEVDDRGWKASHYRHRASLGMYLLVSSQERRVEVHRRGERRWEIEDVVGEGELVLESIGASVPLAEIYEGWEAAREADEALP